VRSHASSLWIICALSFRDWRAAQWAPHHYTVLFFHDEAVALAAGHRPCALCRRPAYDAYRAAVARHAGAEPLRAKEIDARLHLERRLGRSRDQRAHLLGWNQVPDGAFVALAGKPGLVRGDAVVPWTSAGYGAAVARPREGDATVLTPPMSVAALTGGYEPQVDDSARS
jgi:hypothetical protein